MPTSLGLGHAPPLLAARGRTGVDNNAGLTTTPVPGGVTICDGSGLEQEELGNF